MLQLPLPHDKCASRLQSQVHEFTNKRRSSSHNASKATVALCLDRELKLRKNPNLRVISRVQESHLRHYTSLAERSFQETEFRNSTTVSWPLNPVPVLSILMCLTSRKDRQVPFDDSSNIVHISPDWLSASCRSGRIWVCRSELDSTPILLCKSENFWYKKHQASKTSNDR
jgi:hypothetical protein